MFIQNANLRKSLGMQRLLNADSGADGGVPTGADNGNGEGTQPTEPTFEELLKNPKHQSEFDKKIAKSLETAKSKWETEYQSKIEEAKSEAAKLAKMSADEKAAHEQQKKIDALTQREKDINTRELKAQAYEELAERNLPKDLIGVLNFNDADSCKASIEAVAMAFQTSVEKAVNDRLRQKETPKGGQGGDNNGFAFNFTPVNNKK